MPTYSPAQFANYGMGNPQDDTPLISFTGYGSQWAAAHPNPTLTAGPGGTAGPSGGTATPNEVTGATSVGDIVNKYNQGWLDTQYQNKIPGYAGLTAQSSQNIGSLLKGELPADVLRQLGQQAAERGVATGAPTSPNASAAYLRALGLTSLDLTGKGESELTGAVSRTNQTLAPLYDLSQQLTTAGQRLSSMTQIQLEQMREQHGLTIEQMKLLAAIQDRMAGGQGRGGGGGGSALTSGGSHITPFPTGEDNTSGTGSAYTNYNSWTPSWNPGSLYSGSGVNPSLFGVPNQDPSALNNSFAPTIENAGQFPSAPNYWQGGIPGTEGGYNLPTSQEEFDWYTGG